MADHREAIMFKKGPDGYVFRAPNPWLLGRKRFYLVNEAEKTKLLAVITARSQAVFWVTFATLIAASTAALAYLSGHNNPTTRGFVIMLALLRRPGFHPSTRAPVATVAGRPAAHGTADHGRRHAPGGAQDRVVPAVFYAWRQPGDHVRRPHPAGVGQDRGRPRFGVRGRRSLYLRIFRGCVRGFRAVLSGRGVGQGQAQTGRATACEQIIQKSSAADILPRRFHRAARPRGHQYLADQ